MALWRGAGGSEDAVVTDALSSAIAFLYCIA